MKRPVAAIIFVVALIVSLVVVQQASAASLSSLKLAKTSVAGGNSVTATIGLDAAAGSSGLVVTLASSNPALATVPATATVASGKTTKTFTVKTLGVATAGTVTISASSGGITKTVDLAITPPALASITFSPSTVGGGKTVSGSVTLTGTAAVDVVVALSSTNAVAAVPASVTVAPGAKSATFAITTERVTSATTATIGASYGGVAKTKSLTVAPTGVLSLGFSPGTVVGGQGSTGTVKLNGPAPSGGFTVTLGSNQSAASLPPSVVVAAGAEQATFGITTNPVTAQAKATITATGGGSKTATLTINPPAISSLSLSASSTFGGSDPLTATVKLTGPAAVDTTISISNSHPTVVTAPSSVTIPAGSSSVSFSVLTKETATTTSVTLSATYAGVTRTAKVTVTAVSVSRLAFNPTTINAGGVTTGTITLSAPAGANGATVALSSGSFALTVPATVEAPAGATTATFIATGGNPASQTSASVTASLGGVSKSASVTVRAAPVRVAEVVALPNPVGSQSMIGLGIALTGPAPSGGYPVTVVSNNLGLLPLAGNFTIPAGDDSVAIFATTGNISVDTTVAITVVAGGENIFAEVALKRYAVSSVTLPTSTVGGGSVSGRVYLTGPAPSGGVSVNLVSSNPAAATVPTSVSIPAGSTSAAFTIATNGVTTSTPVTVSATSNGTAASATMTVAPPTLSSIWSNLSQPGPSRMVRFTVDLTGKAPAGGATVTLTTSHPDLIPVPPSVVVPAGQTQATFDVVTGTAATSTAVTVTSGYAGTTRTSHLTVQPLAPSGWHIVSGGLHSYSTHTNRLFLNGPAPAGGFAVALSYSGGAIFGPSSVVVPEGATEVTVTFTSATVVDVTASSYTATANGISKSASFSVVHTSVTAFVVEPTSVQGGAPATVTVTYAHPATVGGAPVYVTSNNPAVVVPSSVVMPEGQSSVSFAVTTTPVASAQTVTLTVSVRGGIYKWTTTLTVLPPRLTGLALDPTPVDGGDSATGTVTLDGPAPAGGLAVQLTTSSATASAPASVTVAAGETSATFTVATSEVSADETVSVNATLGADTLGADLLVRAAPPTGQEEQPSPTPTEEAAPTTEPTAEPTATPTEQPTEQPTEAPTSEPSTAPTAEPTATPTEAPAQEPTAEGSPVA